MASITSFCKTKGYFFVNMEPAYSTLCGNASELVRGIGSKLWYLATAGYYKQQDICGK